MASKVTTLLSCALLLVAATCQAAAGHYNPPSPGTCGLKVGYYHDKCPHAEAIVKHAVKAAVLQNRGTGAGLIRMLFHDCFVEGCDASVLLDPTPANPQPEKLGPPNNPSLRGFEVIDAAKAALERACPGVVSCADIVAFAARDASFFLSGRRVDFDMPAGRLDGRVSIASRTLDFLPPPTFSLSQLVASFAAKGLGVEDMVVLSGAHTVGRSHCSSFVPDRLAVPSDINAGFANFLRGQCPANPSSSNDPTVVQDVVTPDNLDNQYYRNVQAHRVLFTSDASLLTSPATAKMVSDNANIPGWWEDRFKAAMVKMASVEVKTGSGGEVRRNCRVVNY
ncbi:peroxidase 2-like [Phragmites australis]|uniref:peroxidase 2-like n=1 Tax=Phragmites australis TaxID=29695 RepID=UPI002D776DA7|nr:peroxidase 2-like [Phragmites australis]